MYYWSSLSLPDSMNPIMEQLNFFHDHTMMIMMIILTMVTIKAYSLKKNLLMNNKFNEHQALETTWTILPAMTLIIIAIPSLKILYLMEELISPSTSIKAMGHQWYWSYEYSDNNKINMESYMKKNKSNPFRLLETDNRTMLPFQSQTRLIVSSSDVIHSWTIPNLGLKMDATPGRLNQMSLLIKTPGIFFGQCSEICGTNHSFMPITIEAVSMKTFIKWMKTS
nr:cytochrome c oxidase subunit II [Borysthenes sp. 2 WQW-2023a]